jgi:hypothetical protein
LTARSAHKAGAYSGRKLEVSGWTELVAIIFMKEGDAVVDRWTYSRLFFKLVIALVVLGGMTVA